MRILALEREVPGVADDAFEPHLRDEAARAWELYQAGILRELHFRDDRPEAVLVLECDSLDAAEESLATLPLVRHGLLRFELIPLRPYPGFARLFGAGT
jgi:hypothetical protein